MVFQSGWGWGVFGGALGLGGGGGVETSRYATALSIRYYKTGGICGQVGRCTNTACQNAQTQYQFSSVTDSYTPQDRITERNKTHKGEHSRENERWRRTRIHGQLPRNFDEKLVYIEGHIDG